MIINLNIFRCIFGMNTVIQNHLHYIDEHKIIYPAGYHVVEYNMQDKS